MNDAALLEKFISAVINALVVGFIGGGIAFGWWMLKKLLDRSKPDEPEQHAGRCVTDEQCQLKLKTAVSEGLKPLEIKMDSKFSEVHTRLDLHFDKPAVVLKEVVSGS